MFPKKVGSLYIKDKSFKCPDSLWFSSWAGDGKLLSTGVGRYVSSARYGS